MKRINLFVLVLFVAAFLPFVVVAQSFFWPNPSENLPDTIGPMHPDVVENLLLNGDFENSDYTEENPDSVTWRPDVDFLYLVDLPGWTMRGNDDVSYHWFRLGNISMSKHLESNADNQQYVRFTLNYFDAWHHLAIYQKIDNLEIGATYCLDFFIRQYIQKEGYLSNKFTVSYRNYSIEEPFDIYDTGYNPLAPTEGNDFFDDTYMDWTYFKVGFVAKSQSVAIKIAVEDFTSYNCYDDGVEHIVDIDQVRLYKVAEASIENAAMPEVKVTGGKGYISIANLPEAEQAEIYAINGALAYKGRQGDVPLAPGCYAVKVLGSVKKVIVR